MELAPQQMMSTYDGGFVQQYMEISWRFSETLRGRHSRHIGPLQSIWSLTTVCDMGGFTTSRSWVERYSRNSVYYDHMLTRLDHGSGVKDPMPYGRIDEWVFLIMDDMSPDYGTVMKSQRKTEIMEVSNNDL